MWRIPRLETLHSSQVTPCRKALGPFFNQGVGVMAACLSSQKRNILAAFVYFTFGCWNKVWKRMPKLFFSVSREPFFEPTSDPWLAILSSPKWGIPAALVYFTFGWRKKRLEKNARVSLNRYCTEDRRDSGTNARSSPFTHPQKGPQNGGWLPIPKAVQKLN